MKPFLVLARWLMTELAEVTWLAPWVVPAAVFVSCAVTLVVLLAPTATRSKNAKPLAERYWAAIGLFAALSFLAHVGAALVFNAWHESSGAAWAALPAAAATVIEGLVASSWYPWRDLFVGPEQAAESVALAASVCAAGIATFALAPRVESSIFLARNVSPWLRRAARPALGLTLLSLFFAIDAWPTLNASPATPLPLSLWTSAFVLWALFVGLLRCRSAEETALVGAPSGDATPARNDIGRMEWERALKAKEALLFRTAFGGAHAALIHADGDDAKPGAAWMHARPPLHGDGAFHLLGSADSSAAPWSHQREFVGAVVEALQGGRSEAVLLKTAYSSGRTVAMFEAAIRVFLDSGKRSLLVYPSEIDARDAHRLFADMLGRADVSPKPRVALLTEDGLVSPPPDVLVACASSIDGALLPRMAPDRGERSGAWQSVAVEASFAERLGFLGLEDAEAYSGMMATNLALVLRRYLRVVERLGASPVLGISLCASPHETSGIQEFVEGFAAERHLVEAAIRDGAPNKDVFVYVLDRAPARLDAEDGDALPPSMTLALLSRAFGAPVHLQSADSVTASDRDDPRWFREDSAKAALEAGTLTTLPRAFVHVRELPLRQALSGPMRVLHGGTRIDRYTNTEHLAVLVPAMRNREAIRWALHAWARSRFDDRLGLPGTWNTELYPLGCRLVRGSPSPELTRRHLRAALAEAPGSVSELAALVVNVGANYGADGADEVRAVLRDLEDEKRLERESARSLGANGQLVAEDRFRTRAVVCEALALESVTKEYVRLVPLHGRNDPSDQHLTVVDRERLLRAAYPGKLFHHEGARYRVLKDRYVEAWQRIGSGGERWLACSAADTLGYTEPALERRLVATKLSELAPRTVTLERGKPFMVRRASATSYEAFRGYWEFTDDGAGAKLKRTFERWQGEPIEQGPTDVRCLVLTLPWTGQERGLVTMRRMLTVALQALLEIDPDDVIVEVFDGYGLDGVDPVDDRIHVVVVDPWAGGHLLIDAIEATDSRFLENLFKFAWLWADDLAGRTLSWDHIGYSGARPDDESRCPRPAPDFVRDALAEVLGSGAVRWRPSSDDPTTVRRFGGHEWSAYGKLEPDATIALVEQVLDRAPKLRRWSIEDLARLWEWVHAHVYYRYDKHQYGVEDHPASVGETLVNGAGDCEDFAILFGSFANALGASARVVLAPGHAWCEVELGHHTNDDGVARLERFYDARAKEWGLERFAFPNYLAEIKPGWQRRGEGFVRTSDEVGVYQDGVELWVRERNDGRRFLTLDACSARAMGSVAGLKTMKCLKEDGDYVDETVVIGWTSARGPFIDEDFRKPAPPPPPDPPRTSEENELTWLERLRRALREFLTTD